MENIKEKDDFWTEVLKYIFSSPELSVALFFMWLCGYILNFFFFQTNPKFEKHEKMTNNLFFRLAIGAVPGLIIILIYNFICSHRLFCSLEDLQANAITATLILSGIVTIILFWKGLKK